MASATGTGVLSLRPGGQVLEISADQLQLTFPNYTATFDGAPVVRAAKAILARAGGGATADEVTAAAAAETELAEEFVAHVATMLLRSRCLAVGPPDGDDGFYAYASDDPAAVTRALEAASPLLVHAGPSLAEEIGLAGMGCETVAAEAGASCGELLEHVEARLGNASVLVVWDVPYRMPLAASLNELGLRHETPVLFGSCEALVGRVGPYAVARTSACLECATSRLLSHAGAPERVAVAGLRARYRDRVPERWPQHAVFARSVAAQLVLELERIVAGFAPQTVNGLIECSFADGSARRRPLHRVPGCPACSRARPQRLPWDVSFSAPIVKSAS